MTPSNADRRSTDAPFGKICIVAPESAMQEALRQDLTPLGVPVWGLSSLEELAAAAAHERVACVLLAFAKLDSVTSDRLAALGSIAPAAPVVIVTKKPPLSAVVRVMRAGAVDVLESPVPTDRLRSAVMAALSESARRCGELQERRAAAEKVAQLSPKQFEVLKLAIEGLPNKTIAERTRVSLRTVERHRAAAFEVLDVATLTEAARVILKAGHDPSGLGAT